MSLIKKLWKLAEYYADLRGWEDKKIFRKLYGSRVMKRVKELFGIMLEKYGGEYDVFELCKREMKWVSDWAKKNKLEWSIETCLKRFLDWEREFKKEKESIRRAERG